MEEMRIREGEKLKEDILLKLDIIKNNVEEIEKVLDNIFKNYKKKFEEWLGELLLGVDIDESRIVFEVVIFLDKVVVDEEIIRFKSYLN